MADVPTNVPTDLSALEGLKVGKDGSVRDPEGQILGQLVEGDPRDIVGQAIGEKGEIWTEDGELIGRVQLMAKDTTADQSQPPPDLSSLEPLRGLCITEKGDAIDHAGEVVARVADGDPSKMAGLMTNENGEILNKSGERLGSVELIDQQISDEGRIVDKNDDAVGQITADQDTTALVGKVVNAQTQAVDSDGQVIGKVEGLREVVHADRKILPVVHNNIEDQAISVPNVNTLKGLMVNDKGKVIGKNGNVIGELRSGDLMSAVGKTVDEQGLIYDEEGNTLGAVKTLLADEEVKATTVKEGQSEAIPALPPISTLFADGTQVGELIEGDPKKLWRGGFELDGQGQFYDHQGHVIGKAQRISVEEEPTGPFTGFDDLFVVPEGWVQDVNGNRVGRVVDGNVHQLLGHSVDDDGDILDKRGNIIGRAERWEAPEPEPDEFDLSMLTGLKPTKRGFVLNASGMPIARVVEGNLKQLKGHTVDGEGQIRNDDGTVLGRVELLPQSEREPKGPFSGLGELIVGNTGFVEVAAGDIVGRLVEGDPKALRGRWVDEDGEIVDRHGTIQGRAERYEPPDEESDEDLSTLEGKMVNKLGNVVNGDGVIFGRVVAGNPRKLAGRPVDAAGLVWSDNGRVLAQAELISPSEREKPQGIFAGLRGLVVGKSGLITNPEGGVVGKLVGGDLSRLIGRAVDEDGDVLDKRGNTIGHVERYAAKEAAGDISPMAGCKLTHDGEVRDGDGTLIGKLTQGNLTTMAGMTIDDNGYIRDDDGTKIGECTLLEKLSAEEKEPFSAEELQRQEEQKQRRELAKNMCAILRYTLDSLEPLHHPTTLNADEQVAANMQARGTSHEAASTEYQPHLTQIEGFMNNRQRLVAEIPHTRMNLHPIWMLLSEPLLQITTGWASC
ncbi:hypothetical protein BO71DRAFT_468984 [Aspergillus ellipticus CBS 707.79]|uniref:LEA domain protein n=1 Tax=Aspergillus ellipticus CBS 707.79 TaxID=1448320 RepID=A0A319E8Z9_9EURO|nr:hypothetical protein BO71DRAFT_468984 [Aspergillus ellipticus CBS 707.79]